MSAELHAHYSTIAVVALAALFFTFTLLATGLLLAFCKKTNTVFSLQPRAPPPGDSPHYELDDLEDKNKTRGGPHKDEDEDEDEDEVDVEVENCPRGGFPSCPSCARLGAPHSSLHRGGGGAGAGRRGRAGGGGGAGAGEGGVVEGGTGGAGGGTRRSRTFPDFSSSSGSPRSAGSACVTCVACVAEAAGGGGPDAGVGSLPSTGTPSVKKTPGRRTGGGGEEKRETKQEKKTQLSNTSSSSSCCSSATSVRRSVTVAAIHQRPEPPASADVRIHVEDWDSRSDASDYYAFDHLYLKLREEEEEGEMEEEGEEEGEEKGEEEEEESDVDDRHHDQTRALLKS